MAITIKTILLAFSIIFFCAQASQASSHSYLNPVALLASYVKADTRPVTLDQMPIATFMPTADADKCAQDKPAIFDVIKKGQGHLKINGNPYQLVKGIPDNLDASKPITIFAGGCNPFANFLSSSSMKNYKEYRAYVAKKTGLFDNQGACIVFTNVNDTNRLATSFGGNKDSESFGLLYDAITKKYPNTPIILYGVCKGALTQLHFVSDRAQNNSDSLRNLKGMIIESPVLSFKDLLKNYGVDCTLTHWAAKALLPNTSVTTARILDVPQFANIPVLLATLKKDTVTTITNVQDLRIHLEKVGASYVELFVSEESLKHGHIGKDSNFQQKARAFISHIAL